MDVRFTHVPSNMTLARMIRLNKVPERPRLLDSHHGLREMEDKDVPGVAALYERYMQRYGMSLVMTEDEVRHHFLSGRGEGPSTQNSWKSPREGQVVWAYVVEVRLILCLFLYSKAHFDPFPQDPKSHKITDFFSFYNLPSTIMSHERHNLLQAAYLFYYATDVAFQEGGEESGRLKKRLEDLIGDALIIADQAKFDVFNALTLMDNVSFLRDLKACSLLPLDLLYV